MEDKVMNISDELLQNISIEELVDLKFEVDELIGKFDSILETCNEALNI